MDFYVAFRTARDWLANHADACPVPPASAARADGYRRAWCENFAFALCADPQREEPFTSEELAEMAATVPSPTPAHLAEAERDLEAIAREADAVLTP